MTQMTVESTYQMMHEKLSKVVPDFELRYKAELAYKINRLKKERNALILGHNYMEPTLFHSVPDFKGDSLELSRRAAETDKDIIVFCGVRFMAETAKILSPEKTVLLPSAQAGCSLAASITGEDVRQLKAQYPGVPVVTYVNCYADVKAETDVCCTSSNAVAVIESLDVDTVIFLPDEYLAKNVARETGRRIIFPVKDPRVAAQSKGDAHANTPADTPASAQAKTPADAQAYTPTDTPTLEYTMVGWHGKCEVHEQFTVEDITNVRKQFPDVVVLAHPECSPEVVEASDFSGSTSAIIHYVQTMKAPHYLLLTECSMGDNILAENPDKDMLRLCSIRCPHMGQITLEETLEALEKTQHVIEIPEDIRVRARRSVERMLEILPKKN